MTEPTDAELEALAVEHEAFGFGRADKQGLSTHGFDPDGLQKFARAVLAKWGTPPAVAGEPVAWEATVPGYIKYVTQSRYERFSAIAKSGYKPFKCSSCTTPQPTQAQAGAVPLTDEQLAEIMRETWGCASIAPRHAIGFARAIERAHGIGIKGGQHGAE